MSGYAELEAFIAGVEKLREMNERVAKEALPAVAEIARSSPAAGRTPDGEAWPDKQEGGRALTKSPDEIEVTTKGNRIVMKIGRPYVYHHHGAGGWSTSKKAEASRKSAERKRAKSGTTSKFHAPRRQIIPVGDAIPSAMNEAVAEVAKRVFDDAMGGD